MTNLGYAAAVFPRLIIIVSSDDDVCYLIARDSDGDDAFDRIAGYIAQEMAFPALKAWINLNLTEDA